MPDDALSEADKKRLANYVSNTEGPVFVLTHLPEVVKGALFSRYSRSTLGLRQLLLKDFLADSEPASAVPPSELSVERAQDFYDRILDGYGDDSIGELGGAHVALENVSMIATKILEDARIGGSPLEKSTRYVSFAEKEQGEYLFYQEPRLMASAHGERYLAVCRALFAGYAEMIDPMTAHVETDFPRDPGQSDAAYRRAVRSRALDSLRGLLPASTRTNMGIFGNGRFFESLLIRLRFSGLAECEILADEMQRELGKLIPSFIRRAVPGHKHLAGFEKFQRELDSLTRGFAEQAPPAEAAPPGSAVRLVRHDPDGEARVLAALAFGETRASLGTLEEWAAGLDEETRSQTLRALADARENRRHKLPRALEAVAYTFDLVGDFGMYRDLHRHRMLTQQRQPLGTHLGYEMPDEVADAGLDGQYAALMAEAAAAYEAIAEDFPKEAQYVVPMAYRIRWTMQVNLRALMWLVELRSTPQGHPAYRRMAQEMFRCVEAVQPALAGLIKFIDLDDYALGRLAAEERQEAKRQKPAPDGQLAIPGVEGE